MAITNEVQRLNEALDMLNTLLAKVVSLIVGPEPVGVEPERSSSPCLAEDLDAACRRAHQALSYAQRIHGELAETQEEKCTGTFDGVYVPSMFEQIRNAPIERTYTQGVDK